MNWNQIQVQVAAKLSEKALTGKLKQSLALEAVCIVCNHSSITSAVATLVHDSSPANTIALQEIVRLTNTKSM